MEKTTYIGLDISTSIIGISLMDEDYNLISLDYLDLRKKKNIFDKSREVAQYFHNLKTKISLEDVEVISIEESMQSFRSGFSSAKTISQLNRFNGIVSYIVSSQLNKDPIYINVNSARKNLEIKLDKKSETSTKDQILSWVDKDLNSCYEWPKKTLKSGPNKGNVKLIDACYDMADAYVICKAIKFYDK